MDYSQFQLQLKKGLSQIPVMNHVEDEGKTARLASGPDMVAGSLGRYMVNYFRQVSSTPQIQ